MFSVPLTLFLAQSAQANPFLGFLPMALILVIFYFVLLMPLQRQRKRQKELLAGLRSGNIVQTSGGIVGTVVSLNPEDDTLILRVKPDNIKLQLARSAIAGLISEK